jgi:dihydrolipoamide dehydrogenase
MNKYDLIVIGTGSAMNLVSPMIQMDPKMKVAVIDKDDPGGICLTRGCIPSKILLYPAELIRMIESAKSFGIDVKINKVDFGFVMNRMRNLIEPEIQGIRHGLNESPFIDYYPEPASFVGPYTLRVGKERISSKQIFLCTGSKPFIPTIKGLEKVKYMTSREVLQLKKLPPEVVILGGGYIAAEYGHFLSSMGSKVIILGRNPQFLPQEEPEISALAKRELSKHMKIYTNHEVIEVKSVQGGKIKVIANNRDKNKKVAVETHNLILALGRVSNSDILHPEKSGIKTDKRGWIIVNKYMQTSQPGIWAFGDATGKYLFKHVANYESMIVYYNAVFKKKVAVDYHAVPHAVFTHPEIAGVGMRMAEAVELLGAENIMVGIQKYEDTAKGEAMGVKDYFVKVIVEQHSGRILGAHIIGPQASVLIQEIINLMYTKDQSVSPIRDGMHIHPALSEVVERAIGSLRPLVHKHTHEHVHQH